jgi:hypothetical protein
LPLEVIVTQFTKRFWGTSLHDIDAPHITICLWVFQEL